MEWNGNGNSTASDTNHLGGKFWLLYTFYLYIHLKKDINPHVFSPRGQIHGRIYLDDKGSEPGRAVLLIPVLLRSGVATGTPDAVTTSLMPGTEDVIILKSVYSWPS